MPQAPLEDRAFGANNYSLFSITWGWNLCLREGILTLINHSFMPPGVDFDIFVKSAPLARPPPPRA